MVRVLLQADGQCQLAGISVGGWIVLSLLAGILLGVAATLLGQWYRRKKQLRYLDKALPITADERGLLQQQPSSIAMQHMPGTASAVRLPPAPGARPGPPKYYSPLTKSLSVGPGMLTAQLSQGDHRSMRTTEAGDIHSRVLQDQSSLSDMGHTQPEVLTANPNNPFAAHGHTAPAEQLGTAAVTEAGAIGHLHQGLRASQHLDQMRQSRVVGTSRLQPQSITSRSSSLDPTTDYQLPASIIPKENSNVASPAASSLSEAYQAPGVQLQQQGQGAAAAARQQWGSAPGSSAAGSISIQAEHIQAESAGIKAEASATESEIADEYEIEDLDDDWKALLTDVDARLIAQGCRVMNAKERSVAIKKMLVATGTRGVDFAMHATLQEVLAFRRIHGN